MCVNSPLIYIELACLYILPSTLTQFFLVLLDMSVLFRHAGGDLIGCIVTFGTNLHILGMSIGFPL